MSTQIGEVNINLRMSLAQFKQDTRQGTDEATRASKQMADAFKQSSGEAKASLALLSEEIGVGIPRHLRVVIAELPGVGQALNAAFSSVAALALIEVLVKIVEKITAVQEAEAKAKEELEKLNKSFEDDIQKLTTAHGAWVDLGNSIQDVSDKWYNAQKKQAEASSGFVNTVLGSIGYAYDFYKQKLLGTTEAAQTAADAQHALLSGIAQIAKQEGPKAALEALNQNLSMLGLNLKQAGPEVQDVAAKLQSQLNKELDEAKKKAEAAMQKLKEMNAEMLRTLEGVRKLPTVNRPYPGLQLPSGDNDLGTFGGLSEVGKVQTQTPINTGTKEAQELYKIQTDQNEAVKEAQKIYTETRTSAEQYANQLAVLDELLKQGKIDQETYNRAKEEAKAKNDELTRSEMEFGKSIGDTLKQAALFGRSWSDAFKSMAVELIQLILKMTLLKSITDSISVKKGGGGFFGSLLSGFAGLFADGGYIGAGEWGIAGEAGPEIISGGSGGVTVTPMGSGGSKGNTYHIDARGAAPGTAEQIRRALQQVEDRAVARSITTISDINRRRA